jgi:hypothetical protein
MLITTEGTECSLQQNAHYNRRRAKKMFNRMLITTFLLLVIATSAWYSTVAEAQAPQFVTEGLVSFWSFDKPSIKGETVKDLWGNNDGILSGNPEFVKGKFLEALSFDGVDNTVEIPHDASIEFPDTSFSIEFWFKGEPDTLAVHGYVFCKGFSGGHGKRYEFIILDEGDPPTSKFFVDDDVAKGNVAFDSHRFTDEEWHHWVFVRDVEDAELRIYMDGAEVAIGEDVSKQSISNDNSLFMGRMNPNEPGAKPGHVLGLLDEFRIYDRALSDDEIEQNYAIESNVLAVVDHAGKIAISWGKIKNSSAFGRK